MVKSSQLPTPHAATVIFQLFDFADNMCAIAALRPNESNIGGMEVCLGFLVYLFSA
jgi:hypothetical protein